MKANFAKFFHILEPLLWLINISPHSLFNYDEMGPTDDWHKVCKVTSITGKQRVSLSSAERGSLVTNVTCMNATVTNVHHPVFPRSNMKVELLDSVPPGSISACHKAGWIQKECFTQWFKHFVHSVKLSERDLVTLTMCGYYSHSRSIKAIDRARKNREHVVFLPPHSTHNLQPLDVSFLQPLKT
jgi:DDE superfamily endonuclease.